MSSNRLRAILLLVLSGVFAASCTKGPGVADDPKNRLSDYINRSFNARTDADRQAMLDFLTGDAKSRLAAWSPDQFKEAFIDSKRQFLKLAFRETKSVSENEISITYELSYLDQKKGRDAKVTNKKLAQLLRQNGKWYVGDVHNIKELIEYQNEIALP
jgi:hypothetical protein